MQDIDVKSIVPYELEIRTIPQFDPDDPKMISQGPSVCVFNKDDPQQVLATWLFAQYLLSNDVQIAYSETEGYIPVTLKAQESDEYLDYLSREGEDDVEHYAGKIQCAKMLLANKENTFVTPVYNGSASLRDAAGELIEQTVSQVRKGGAADDAFFDDLFEKVVSLKRLNLNGTAADGKADLGPLPSTSVVLLVSLGVAWLILGSVFAVILIREKRKK
jgi:multiple sugar transport system substrate-binding protein